MKKIFLLLICLFPVFVKADYSVNDYRVDITVKESGDINIIEAFSMEGIYNGFEKTVDYTNIYDNYLNHSLYSVDKKFYEVDKIVLNEIRSIDYSNDLNILDLTKNSYLFEEDKKAKKGEYGVYSIIESEDILYKIYNPSMMNKDFYINYTVFNAVINHEDISELVLNVLTNNKQSIDNLQITINIPNNKELLKVWLHSKQGIINISDSETIKIDIKDLNINDNVDIRLVFDKGITFGDKKSLQSVLDKIIYIESNYDNLIKDSEYEDLKEEAYNILIDAEKTNNRDKLNEAIKIVNNLKESDYKTELIVRLIKLEAKVDRKEAVTNVLYSSIMGLLVIGLLVIFYYIYKRYDYKYEKYNSKYCSIKPSDYKPYIVSFLLNGKIKRQDLYASVLDLLNNNKLAIKKTKSDYKLIKISGDDLTFSEERLIKFLLNKEDETTFKKMQTRAKKHYKSFINKYSNWYNAATYEGNLKEFYEDILYIRIFAIVYCIISIVICLLLIDKSTYFSPFIAITIFVIATIYFILFYKRTKKGNEEYYKWKAFERYLKKEDNDYLTYSIALGCKVNNDELKEFRVLKENIDKCLDIAYKTRKEE